MTCTSCCGTSASGSVDFELCSSSIRGVAAGNDGTWADSTVVCEPAGPGGFVRAELDLAGDIAVEVSSSTFCAWISGGGDKGD